MKIAIESTTRIVMANDVPCRVWEGHTENGVAVTCLIPRIAVNSGADAAQFEAELREQKAPSAEGEAAFPLRMVL
jgi:hypothetical protein